MGTAIQGMLWFTKSMQTFMGPTMNAMLAVQGLTIAFDTQRIVMRAMRGEVIAADMGRSNRTMAMNAENFQLNANTQAMILNHAALEAEGVALEETLVRKTALSGIEGSRTRSQAAHYGQLKAITAAIKENSMALDESAAKMGISTKRTSILGDEILRASMNMLGMSITLGAIGSGMMAFGKYFGDADAMMRRGMILTTAAMALQMFQTIKSIKATGMNIAAEKTKQVALAESQVEHIETAAAIEVQTGATLELATANGVAAGSMSKAAKAGKTMGRSLGLLGVGLLFMEGLQKTLFENTKDNADAMDEYSGAIADTALVLDYLEVGEQARLDRLEAIRVALLLVNDAETETRLKTERESIMTASHIDMVRNLTTEEGNKLAEDYYGILERQNQALKDQTTILGEVTAFFKGIVDFSFDLNDNIIDSIPLIGDEILKLRKPFEDFGFGIYDSVFGGLLDDTSSANKEMEAFVEANEGFAVWMKAHSELGPEELKLALEEYIKTLKDSGYTQDDFFDGTTAALSDTIDKIHEFGNAREELFFGFSSDRLTGDMIRQVRQQGVETLITSTEVIMTNNFNGMTVPEVANQIIEELNQRGYANGINFATT